MQLFLDLHRLYKLYMYDISTIYDKIDWEFMKRVEINQISVTKNRLYSKFDRLFKFTGSV